MAVTGENLAQILVRGGPIYKNGLCSCLASPKALVESCVCFPCQSSRVYQVLVAAEAVKEGGDIPEGVAKEDNWQENGFNLNIPCCVASWLTGCFAQCFIRSKARSVMEIDEGCCCSCCCACFFPICSHMQMFNELQERGAWPGSMCYENPNGNGAVAAPH
jgi:hypothetical protein